VSALLTINDVAERLSISYDAVLTHIRAGRLKAANVGQGWSRPRWRIEESDLAAFLATRSNPAPVQASARKRRQITPPGI
jgi:excisionase family DNA binding protein